MIIYCAFFPLSYTVLYLVNLISQFESQVLPNAAKYSLGTQRALRGGGVLVPCWVQGCRWWFEILTIYLLRAEWPKTIIPYPAACTLKGKEVPPRERDCSFCLLSFFPFVVLVDDSFVPQQTAWVNLFENKYIVLLSTKRRFS